MQLGYVCTNFNNSGFTRKAVRSFLASGPCEHRVVVVDNRSEPPQVRMLQELREELPAVELLLNQENVGYFPGLNLGIRHLRAKFPELDHLVVGNNDLEFPADFLRSIEACAATFAAHPVVSPDVVTLDGVHQNPHVIARIGAVRELVYDAYYANYFLALLIKQAARLTHGFTDREDETYWRVAQPIYQGHGSCYILGPLFFQHFEELWAPTFLMHEEYFLSKQLIDKGMQVYYQPAISVRHHCHATIDKVPGRKMWELAREAHRVYRRYVTPFGKRVHTHELAR